MSSGQDNQEPAWGDDRGSAERSNATSQQHGSSNDWQDLYTPNPPPGLLDDTTIPLDSEGWQKHNLQNESKLSEYPDLLTCDEDNVSALAAFHTERSLSALMKRGIAEIEQDRERIQELKQSIQKGDYDESESSSAASVVYHRDTQLHELDSISVSLIDKTHRLQKVALEYKMRFGHADILHKLSQLFSDSINKPTTVAG